MIDSEFAYTTYAPDTDPGAGLNWRYAAVCREEDPDLFFPIGHSGPALMQIEEAKAVCGRCPVAVQCREWALATRQEHGVWGGLSEDDRRRLRRRAARRRAATRPKPEVEA